MDSNIINQNNGNNVYSVGSGYSTAQQQHLINSVISVLESAEKDTNVSKQYSNDNNLAVEIQAYAKISGNNWTYYVKDLEISIGRNTTDGNPAAGNRNLTSIDLGPAKVVSRKHAEIKFNMQIGGWELYLYGRNGAKVNFKRAQVNSRPIPISSGTVLDIGSTQMMFILPDQEPFVQQACLNHLIPKLSLFYDQTNSNNSKLLNDLIKNSDYYKQNTNNIRNVILNNNNSNISNPNINNNQIRTFKMYGNNISSASSSSISTTASINHKPNSNCNMLLMSPDLSGTSSASSSYPHSYNISNANHSSNGFPPSIDFASDLSHDENRNVKPPHSYATMITQAILSTSEGIISLADIYKFISSNYAYYRFAKTGWQNSIRHNLSLNKAFEKVPRKPNEPGKGMKWKISEDYGKDFMNKWNSGKISKIRRGSSVARQLQLHMSKYNKLPLSIESKDSIVEYQHSLKRSISPAMGINAHQSLPALPQQQQQQEQQRHHHHQQQQQQQQPLSTHRQHDSIANPLMMPPQPTSVSRLGGNHNPTNSALVSFTAASSSASNSNALAPSGSGNISSLPNHIFSLSPHSASNSISSTTSSSLLPPSTAEPTSYAPDIGHLSPSHNPLIHSPTKAFHVTAMEAYTPERGSTHHMRTLSQNNVTANSNINGSDKPLLAPSTSLNPLTSAKSQNGRSSPSLWNLLQFNSATNTPSMINNFSTTENNTNTGNSRNGDSNDVTLSPIKNQQLLTGKELLLDTDSAKITMDTDQTQ